MGRKKKIITDGKIVDTTQPVPAAATMEILTNFTNAKYKTLDESAYVSELKAKSLTDIQRECLDRGMLPSRGREILTERLISEFRKWKGALKASEHKPFVPIENQIVKDIMSPVTERKW